MTGQSNVLGKWSLQQYSEWISTGHDYICPGQQKGCYNNQVTIFMRAWMIVVIVWMDRKGRKNGCYTECTDVLQKESTRLGLAWTWGPREKSESKMTSRLWARVADRMVVLSTVIEEGDSREDLGMEIKTLFLGMLRLSWLLDIHKEMSARQTGILVWTGDSSRVER